MRVINISDKKEDLKVAIVGLSVVALNVFGFGYRLGVLDQLNYYVEADEGSIEHVKGHKEDKTKDKGDGSEVKGMSYIEPKIQKVDVKEEGSGATSNGGNSKDGIQRIYARYATISLQANVDWLYAEVTKRGLNPELVFAVQAKESGWGKSWYCINHGNCFGYGYTDSGKVGNYHGDDYREVTRRILDKYVEQGYGIGDAYTMSKRGYNFNAEWAVVVTEIVSWFE